MCLCSSLGMPLDRIEVKDIAGVFIRLPHGSDHSGWLGHSVEPWGPGTNDYHGIMQKFGLSVSVAPYPATNIAYGRPKP